MAAVVLMNLAVQIARFDSYTKFMKGLKMDVALIKVDKAASSTTLTFKFTVHSNEKKAHAYISSIQLMLKNGNEDLGYYPIVGSQDMLSSFENGVFTSSQYIVVPKRITKISTLSYKAYAEVHFQVGRHDLRSVPLFEGTVIEEAEK